MKKGIVALSFFIGVMTATASYMLLTPPDPPRNLTGSSEEWADDSSIPALLENAVTLPSCPTDANLGRQAILSIVTASADPDEEAQEAEEEDGKDKAAEDGRPDRMWGAVKLG